MDIDGATYNRILIREFWVSISTGSNIRKSRANHDESQPVYACVLHFSDDCAWTQYNLLGYNPFHLIQLSIVEN
jgi:hypothetical protein